MKSNIIIPKKIKVGFCNRTDTYSGKLGYIIMFDGKAWRKEKSWEGWRDKSIESQEFENNLSTGFTINLNKGGVGSGYSRWDTRMEKIRVYDQRGFEFEITLPNLLYILQNTNSIKGKGISGAMIFGWDGKDLVLIPEEAPEYQEMLEFNELQTKKVSRKELIPGGIYINNKNERVTFLEDNYFYDGEGNKKKVLYFTGIEYSWLGSSGIVKLEPKNIKSYTGETDSEYTNWYTKLQDYKGYKDYVEKTSYDYVYTPITDLYSSTLRERLYTEVTLKNGGKKYQKCRIYTDRRVLKETAIPTIVKTITNGIEYSSSNYDYINDYERKIMLEIGKNQFYYNTKEELFKEYTICTEKYVDRRTWSYRLLTDEEKEQKSHYWGDYYILLDDKYVSVSSSHNYKEETIDDVLYRTSVYSLRFGDYYSKTNPYNDDLTFPNDKELVNYYTIYKKVQN